MNWQQIRELHPRSWVVVEAQDGRTRAGKRIIDSFSIFGVHRDNWKAAWEQYKTLHHADKWREYYVLHTDNVELEIGVLDAFMRPVVGDED